MSTLENYVAGVRKDLFRLAREMIDNDEPDCAIALLGAERAIVHAEDVMSQNGIDLATPFTPSI